MRRFELKEGSSSKFWEVTVSGSTLTVRFGRIGSGGQEKSKIFASPALAQEEHDKLIAEKQGKGYKEVGAGSVKKVPPAAPGIVRPARAAKKLADDMLVALRRSKPLKQVAAKLESLQRVSIRITTASARGSPVGMSKLGGHPDLPSGMSWPAGKLGGREIALPFIAQFNLADLRPYNVEGLLPESGILYFFYNMEPYGNDYLKPENWRVIYHDDAGGASAPPAPPISIPPHLDYKVRAVAFQNEVTLPHVETYSLESRIELTEEEWDAYFDLHYKLRANADVHQMLGHADDVQPYALENSYHEVRDVFFPGSSPFKSLSRQEQNEEIFQGRLLLQISREELANMQFGRGGSLFFFIREQDLKARDFSKVWVNEQ